MRPLQRTGVILRVIPEEMRTAAADRLLAAAELPRGLRKCLAVLLFLGVSAMAISGGTLCVAAAMHAVVVRLDMPPRVPYAAYGTAWESYKSSHYGKTGKNIEPLFIVPRPTVAGSLDRVIAHSADPAAPFIQEDAAGLGLFLAREVHGLLMHVFDDATRSRLQLPDLPSGVPITGGQ